MKPSILMTLLLFVSALATSCGSNNSLPGDKPIESQSIDLQTLKLQRASLRVVDQIGRPISGARVLFGQKVGTPFAGNLLTTDNDGRLEIPEAWTPGTPITVDVPRFVRVTYLSNKVQDLAFTLKPLLQERGVTVRGVTSGYANLKKDGNVDCSLILPAIARGRILDFQPSWLVNPELDSMSALGQTMDVPANSSFPKQRESRILPFTLEKPEYRVTLASPGIYKMVAVHAKFDLGDMLDQTDSGGFGLDVVNLFQFQGAGVREVPAATDLSGTNLAVNETAFSSSLAVNAPAFANGFEMLTAAMVNLGKVFYPSDIKVLKSNQSAKLVTPAASTDGFVFSMLQKSFRTDENVPPAQAKQMSANVSPVSASAAKPAFLPMVKAPAVAGGQITLEPPQPGKLTITPLATALTLTDLKTVMSDKVQYEIEKPVWEVYAENWTKTITLPELDPLPAPAGGKQRWTVLFLGSTDSATTAPLGPETLEKASHVTRSAVDL